MSHEKRLYVNYNYIVSPIYARKIRLLPAQTQPNIHLCFDFHSGVSISSLKYFPQSKIPIFRQSSAILGESREPLPNKTTQTAITPKIFQSFEDSSEDTSSTYLLKDPSNHKRRNPDVVVLSSTTSSKTQKASQSLLKSGSLITLKKSLSTMASSIKQGPMQNLFFLKTHKTGSSTLQNILIRYAFNHNRTVGLPIRGVVFPSYFKGHKMAAAELQKVPDGKKINMIMHHMIPDYDVVSYVDRSIMGL